MDWPILVGDRAKYTSTMISDRIVFTDAGVVAEEGPPALLLDHPVQDRTRRFLRMVDHKEHIAAA